MNQAKNTATNGKMIIHDHRTKILETTAPREEAAARAANPLLQPQALRVATAPAQHSNPATNRGKPAEQEGKRKENDTAMNDSEVLGAVTIALIVSAAAAYINHDYLVASRTDIPIAEKISLSPSIQEYLNASLYVAQHGGCINAFKWYNGTITYQVAQTHDRCASWSKAKVIQP